jgi:hypothetical protein
MLHLRRNLVVTFVAVLAVVLGFQPPTAQAQQIGSTTHQCQGDTAPPPKVYVVLIVDTDIKGSTRDKTKNLRLAAKADLGMMTRLFKDTFARDKDRLTLHTLTGANVTPKRVAESLRGLPQMPADTLFVYYSGHGALDPAKGHYLSLTHGGPLLRSDVRKLMAATKARLSILLTDACSDYSNCGCTNRVLLDTPLSVAAVTRKGGKEGVDQNLVRGLLFGPTGVVDVTGAQPGRLANAFGSDPEGGVLTRAFIDSCYPHRRPGTVPELNWKIEQNKYGHQVYFATPGRTRKKLHLDRDNDGIVTWSELLGTSMQPLIVERTASVGNGPDAEKSRYQMTMTYSLPTNPAPPAARVARKVHDFDKHRQRQKEAARRRGIILQDP